MDDGGAASVRAIMHWQYRTICRGQNSIIQSLVDVIGPRVHEYISFYGLRSYGRLFDGGSVASSQVGIHFYSFICRRNKCFHLWMLITFKNTL